MDASDWIAIIAVVISIITAIVSGIFTWKANKISKNANDKADEANRLSNKANEISSKSISIDYDATFNDFHIQLQKNCTELFRLKNDFYNLLTQDRNFIIDYMPQIKKDMIRFQTLKQFMRPSKYADHYDVLERLCEDIKGYLDTMLKIAKESNQDRPKEMGNFKGWHTDALKIYDRILDDFEEKIAEVSDI